MTHRSSSLNLPLWFLTLLLTVGLVAGCGNPSDDDDSAAGDDDDSTAGDDDDSTAGDDDDSTAGDDDDSAAGDDDDSAAGDDDDSAADSLEIIGVWDTSLGPQTITESTWSSGSSIWHISQYDNAADYLVAQNDANNAWSASLWSRFDWHWDSSGQLWYCQTCYNCADEAAALATAAADSSDPATAGCSTFPWSSLTPQ